jgi:ubiquinone/menaquinone biosynthesis C-methylase UbiE
MFTPHQYLGVDCDKKRIEYASRFFHEYDFATISGPEIPLQDHTVDYVLIISVLHHIPTESIPEYLDEFRRLLKDDGTIVIMEPCFHDRSDFHNTLMGFFDKGKYIQYENGYLSLFENKAYQTNILKRFSQLCFYRKILFSAAPIH